VLHGVKVAVVVPAFEEAPRIGRMIRGLPASVDLVVVVDDASSDATGEAARSAACDGGPPVEVVRHASNRGVGAAIATGYRRARELLADERAVLVVMAGDDQMDPRDLPAVVEPIAAGRADYVKGCRFAWPGVRNQMPAARLAGGWAFSVLTSWAVGQRIRDSQCGYTAIASHAVVRLDLDDLWPRYGYPNDLLGQLAVRKLRVAEVPVRPVYADEVSRLRVGHLPTIVGLVGRAWLRRVRADRPD
jgi:glycosyltransferase involved in cell wall biosynthesis